MSTGYRPPDLRRDRARPRHSPAPADSEIEARLTELVSPATYALVDQYRRLGLRSRALTLPVMVCLLVALIWRHIPSVRMLARVLQREQLLWTPPVRVSQQALNSRLRTFPPDLLEQVVHAVLPDLAVRAAARTRPLPSVLATTMTHFAHVWAVDATSLGAVVKKAGLLQEIPTAVLGGKVLALLDLATKLPVWLQWDADARTNERSLLDALEEQLPPGTLLILDKGFFGFPFFDRCTEQGISFIIPDRQTTVSERVQLLRAEGALVDEIVTLGRYRSSPCRHPVRRVRLVVAGRQYVYLTNVLDPAVLHPATVVALYRRRWRIEEAFLLTKRLLGLSYLWTGAANGIALQVWATWLLYAILVDVADQVADELALSIDRISLEMVFRSLYFFVGAAARGEADDLPRYLAHPDQRDLGIVKFPRPPTALDTALACLT